MLGCRSCLWRCLRAICSDIPPPPPGGVSQIPRRSQSTILRQTSNRHASSLSVRTAGGQSSRPENSIIKAAKNASKGSHGGSDHISSVALRRLKLEVPWLAGDRIKVLDRTKVLLRNGREQEALELVRLASKQIECTIAWNALMGDLLEKRKVATAFKIYNDMKKRGQTPDSYTYSILFNGLCANSKVANVGQRAVALWQSLNNPNSKVKPSILLTNAALKACASAVDMDAVWAIAGAIPDQGSEAANSITYTTIINSMRFSTVIEIGAEVTEAQEIALNTAVSQARQIWADVVVRWRRGQLTLDEDLVCAMGRLLHAGLKPQDWDDIFSLCAQTMNIPRQAPPLKAHDSKFVPDSLGQRPPPFGRSDRTIAADAADVPEVADREFGHQTMHDSMWVKPTNQTLTLLVEACQKMFLAKAADKYWKLLTTDQRYAVKPDSVSCHAFLRLLRQSKASADALRFVRDDMKDVEVAGKTFRISMSTCVRNMFSPNAMREATELMDVMLMRLKHLDIKASTMYMKLAIDSPHAQDTLVALAYMTPKRTKVDEILSKGSPSDMATMLDLAKLVVSGFDRVLNANAVPGQSGRQDYQKRKATWTYAVQRLLNGGQRTKPILSDEELALMAKKKALSRFERKRERDRTRRKRQNSHAVLADDKKSQGLPVFESDVV